MDNRLFPRNRHQSHLEGLGSQTVSPTPDFNRSEFAFQINAQGLLLLLRLLVVQADTLRNTVLDGMEVKLGENKWLRSVGSRLPGPHSLFPLFYFHRPARAT